MKTVWSGCLYGSEQRAILYLKKIQRKEIKFVMKISVYFYSLVVLL